MAIVKAAVAAQEVPLLADPIRVPSAHTILVERGSKWLKAKGCNTVMREFYAAWERPDVLGRKGTNGTSFLIEAKASRSDFRTDFGKPWRQHPEQGMGEYRYYLCRPGMIKVADLPQGWGLLYAHEKVITIEHGKDPAGNFVLNGKREVLSEDPFRFWDYNDRGERTMLLSALGRIRCDVGLVDFDTAIHRTYESKRGETM